MARKKVEQVESPVIPEQKEEHPKKGIYIGLLPDGKMFYQAIGKPNDAEVYGFLKYADGMVQENYHNTTLKSLQTMAEILKALVPQQPAIQ